MNVRGRHRQATNQNDSIRAGDGKSGEQRWGGTKSTHSWIPTTLAMEYSHILVILKRKEIFVPIR